MIYKNIILSGFIILCVLFLFPGCAEDEDPEDVASGSTSDAEEALKVAEQKLEAAGISMSFDEPGELVHLEDLLPTTEDLEGAENQSRFEDAISALNIVLAELEQETEDGYLGSISDRALVNLYLGFSYLFDAISRLLISDDPAETFIIELNPGSSGSLYNFGVSPVVLAELDAMDNSLDYPRAFTRKERQAIIDAANLIDDAIVKPIATDIQPRLSSVDKPPYSRYSIWHFEKAAVLFNEYSPEIGLSLESFNQNLENMRAKIQSRAEEWGFTYTLPPGR